MSVFFFFLAFLHLNFIFSSSYLIKSCNKGFFNICEEKKNRIFFQGIGVGKTGIENSKPNEKRARPEKEQALNCPRCNSTNTKFCYYNNYSLSQPRYFCKTCRRYWTAGGSLRNVPVGGGSRKNKRSSSSSAVVAAVSPPDFSPQNPRTQGGHDLNLAYNPSHYSTMSELVALHQSLSSQPSSETSYRHHNLPLMELLKTGTMSAAGGLSSFMSFPISDASNAVCSSDLKPGLGFLIDEFGNHTNQSSRFVFPFGEVKPVSNND